MQTPPSGKVLPFPQPTESLQDSPPVNAEIFASLVKGSPYASVYQLLGLSGLMNKAELVGKIAKTLRDFALQAGQTVAVPSMFDTANPSKISIHDYLVRVSQHTKCSPESLIISLILLDRYVEMSLMVVTAKNVHRFFEKTVFHSCCSCHKVQRRRPPQQSSLCENRWHSVAGTEPS